MGVDFLIGFLHLQCAVKRPLCLFRLNSSYPLALNIPVSGSPIVHLSTHSQRTSGYFQRVSIMLL